MGRSSLAWSESRAIVAQVQVRRVVPSTIGSALAIERLRLGVFLCPRAVLSRPRLAPARRTVGDKEDRTCIDLTPSGR